MIIKTNAAQQRQQKQAVLLKKGVSLLIVVLFLLGLFFLASHSWKAFQKEKLNEILIANAETKEGDSFILNDYKVSGAPTQTNDEVYEGSYSMVLSKNTSSYGFSTLLEDVYVGDQIIVKVWMKSPSKQAGRLAVTSLDTKTLYLQSEDFKFTDEWQIIEVALDVTEPLEKNTLKIYCFNFNE